MFIILSVSSLEFPKYVGDASILNSSYSGTVKYSIPDSHKRENLNSPTSSSDDTRPSERQLAFVPSDMSCQTMENSPLMKENTRRKNRTLSSSSSVVTITPPPLELNAAASV